jgi:hypothetical protein
LHFSGRKLSEITKNGKLIAGITAIPEYINQVKSHCAFPLKFPMVKLQLPAIHLSSFLLNIFLKVPAVCCQAYVRTNLYS